MDRNPSPPPPSRDEDEEAAAGGDCIGSTVYSKHWLFGVLSGLIQVRKRASSGLPLLSPGCRPASGSPPPAPGAAVPSTTPPQARRPGLTPGLQAVYPRTPKLPGATLCAPQYKRKCNGRDAGMLLVRMFYFYKISKYT